jgi:predicted nucleotidyltransferase
MLSELFLNGIIRNLCRRSDLFSIDGTFDGTFQIEQMMMATHVKKIVIDEVARAKRLVDGRNEAARIIAEMGAKGVTVELFGSMKTRANFPNSDIDLLVVDCGPMHPDFVLHEIKLMERAIPIDVSFLQPGAKHT